MSALVPAAVEVFVGCVCQEFLADTCHPSVFSYDYHRCFRAFIRSPPYSGMTLAPM